MVGGLVGVIVSSLAPWMIDYFQDMFPSEEEAERRYNARHGHGGGFVDSGLMEMFGIYTPKEKPPIVAERAQDYNDEDSIEENFHVVLEHKPGED